VTAVPRIIASACTFAPLTPSTACNIVIIMHVTSAPIRICCTADMLRRVAAHVQPGLYMPGEQTLLLRLRALSFCTLQLIVLPFLTLVQWC
jgi:hypothetical protein